MNAGIAAIVATSIICGPILLSAQQPALVTEIQAREWAAYAVSKSVGDSNAFDERFAGFVRILAPAYRVDPSSAGVTVHRSERLSIEVIGPVSWFQMATSQAVRKLLPADSIAWPCGVAIVVEPSQIDAPDIKKVVVKRGGVIVEPIANHLTSAAMTTSAGLTVALHTGIVCYPTSAFVTGAQVSVTAIPAVGSNISKSLGDPDLRKVQ